MCSSASVSPKRSGGACTVPLNSRASFARKASLKMRPFSFSLHGPPLLRFDRAKNQHLGERLAIQIYLRGPHLPSPSLRYLDESSFENGKGVVCGKTIMNSPILIGSKVRTVKWTYNLSIEKDARHGYMGRQDLVLVPAIFPHTSIIQCGSRKCPSTSQAEIRHLPRLCMQKQTAVGGTMKKWKDRWS